MRTLILIDFFCSGIRTALRLLPSDSVTFTLIKKSQNFTYLVRNRRTLQKLLLQILLRWKFPLEMRQFRVKRASVASPHRSTKASISGSYNFHDCIILCFYFPSKYLFHLLLFMLSFFCAGLNSILAEFEFLHYLKEKKISVCAPVHRSPVQISKRRLFIDLILTCGNLQEMKRQIKHLFLLYLNSLKESTPSSM